MAVKRIVANIAASNLAAAKGFYGGILGMEVAMDLGWIMTFTAPAATTPQISIATEGGSGTPVPDLSIEVDNLDEVHGKIVQAGMPVVYGPETEPWGVCRFFVRDPFGRLVNILSHG
jgi:catechol 2,3-dioxygenase-like lactoylglutathione lyase family enzyme